MEHAHDQSKAPKIRTRIEALRAIIDKERTAPACRASGVCRHEAGRARTRGCW